MRDSLGSAISSNTPLPLVEDINDPINLEDMAG
jgi:hypothetical protein